MDCTNKPLKAFIIKIDGVYYIMVDSAASYINKKRLLAHELAHYITNTFYNEDASIDEIRDKEQIANNIMEELLK